MFKACASVTPYNFSTCFLISTMFDRGANDAGTQSSHRLCENRRLNRGNWQGDCTKGSRISSALVRQEYTLKTQIHRKPGFTGSAAHGAAWFHDKSCLCMTGGQSAPRFMNKMEPDCSVPALAPAKRHVKLQKFSPKAHFPGLHMASCAFKENWSTGTGKARSGWHFSFPGTPHTVQHWKMWKHLLLQKGRRANMCLAAVVWRRHKMKLRGAPLTLPKIVFSLHYDQSPKLS